jgi:hypothetical protein
LHRDVLVPLIRGGSLRSSHMEGFLDTGGTYVPTAAI